MSQRQGLSTREAEGSPASNTPAIITACGRESGLHAKCIELACTHERAQTEKKKKREKRERKSGDKRNETAWCVGGRLRDRERERIRGGGGGGRGTQGTLETEREGRGETKDEWREKKRGRQKTKRIQAGEKQERTNEPTRLERGERKNARLDSAQVKEGCQGGRGGREEGREEQ